MDLAEKPKSYFKYFSDIDDVLEGIFRNRKIRFTQPWKMNDPLEFNPSLLFTNEAFAHQSYEIDGIELPPLDLFYRVQIIESQINAYGILSLTTKHMSFDMWSRYANGHKGFLLELKPDFYLSTSMKSKNDKQNAFDKVQYVDKYVLEIEKLVDKQGLIPLGIMQKEIFFKKTSRWKDEEEYRLVRPFTDYPEYKQTFNHSYREEEMFLFDFPSECVMSVVFGANMSIEKKKKIIDYYKNEKVIFYQAVIVRDILDEENKPSSVTFFPIVEYLGVLKEILKIKPQLLCMDSAQNKHFGKKIKIKNLDKLPYYADYKDLVDELIENIKKSNSRK